MTSDANEIYVINIMDIFMVEISNQGPSISEEQVAALEEKLGARLSGEYRRFLLQNNGGRPDRNVVDVQRAPGTPTDVQVFFGIGRRIESSNLGWNLALIVDRCPTQHVLPIACDSGGNLFCLKVTKGIASEVVYCDLDDRNCIFYEVSPSFDALMRAIRILD